jgi:hypothetical protein
MHFHPFQPQFLGLKLAGFCAVRKSDLAVAADNPVPGNAVAGGQFAQGPANKARLPAMAATWP